MMEMAQSFVLALGVAAVCVALGLSRATWYRFAQQAISPAPALPSLDHNVPSKKSVVAPKVLVHSHPRALTDSEEAKVLDVLHETRFQDKAPAQIYAALLDEGVRLCSIRTMYRILHKHGEVHERRQNAMRPLYIRPELLATAPNQLWSWDITLLRGPHAGTYYYLYVMIDVFSRYVVGWMVAQAQNASLAKRFISATCKKQGIKAQQLNIHNDRGAPMTARSTMDLLRRMEIKQTFSRPRVSDDNPYSESHFKTLKYRPNFPNRFPSLEATRSFLIGFFKWYNEEHFHSGIALLPPSIVHHGRSEEVLLKRDKVLQSAFLGHPERFVNGAPKAPRPPTEVWINRPTERSEKVQAGLPGCIDEEPQGVGDAVPEIAAQTNELRRDEPQIGGSLR